jgi:hypothetical protein
VNASAMKYLGRCGKGQFRPVDSGALYSTTIMEPRFAGCRYGSPTLNRSETGMSIFEPSRSPSVSFLLAGEMAVAYFQTHLPLSFWPTTNLGIPAILYCFIYLYYVFAGAGPWSVDAMIARKKGGNRY